MIPLYKPYMPEKLPELENILHSGELAYGKWGRKFEQSISDFTGAPYVATVNSFNAAVQVAFLTLGVGQGDEVITSPQSCLASNMPILSSGATVIWADIDPNTGTLDPESVKSKISPKTKVIFHNHHCGYPGYIDEINTIGKEKGIIIIDDCIEAFGSEYKGKMMGSLNTDVTIFSFQTVRLPNTIDGGAVCFRDKELHEQACKLRDLGIDRTTFRDNLGEISPLSNITKIGIGATMNELNSYIGFQQMEDIANLLELQQLNGKAWMYRLQNDSNCKLLGRAEISPNYWVFGLLCAKGREYGINHFRSLGYYASTVHLPNNNYSVFENKGKEFIGVREFYNHFVALPSGWWINNIITNNIEEK